MFRLVLVGTINKLKECFNSFNILQKPNSKKKKKNPDLPTLCLSAHYANITFFYPKTNEPLIESQHDEADERFCELLA